MKQLYRFLLLAALAAAILPGMQARGQDTLKNRLIFVGDTHYDRLEDHDLVWLQTNYPDDYRQVQGYSANTANNFAPFISNILTQSAALRVRGIVHTGDLVEGLAGSYTLAAQMDNHAIEALRAPDCPAPWVVTKGNHDITGPGQSDAYQGVMLPFISSELNQSITNPYYSWRSGDVEVISIDCYNLYSVTTFLQQALAASTAKYKFVATHQPIIPVTGRLWNIYQDPADSVARRTLLNLIAKYKAVVLCGHLHDFSVVRRMTDSGAVLQVMSSSVIRDLSRTTPYSETTTYGPSLVDLEPNFDPSSALSRKAALAKEAQYVTGFYLADLQGYTVIDINDTTGEVVVKAFCGASTTPYKQISLSGYNLRVDTLGMGSVLVTPAGPSYLANTTVTLKAQPALGWSFSGWSGSLTGSNNPDSVVMDAEKVITASFGKLPAGQTELRVSVVGDGTVQLSPPGPYYSQGTAVTLTAKPGTGDVFGSWSGAAAGTTDTLTVVMDTSKAITATFRALAMHALRSRVMGEGQITASPAGAVYAETSWVSLQAVPAQGWEFAGWSGSLGGSQNPQSMSMRDNREVRALFRKTGSQVWSLNATRDTYVRGSLYASQNFDKDSLVIVREGTSDLYRYRGYVQFDLSGIGSGLKLVQAILQLHSRQSGAFPDGIPARVDVMAAGSDSWTEETLTWKNVPADGQLQDSTLTMTDGDRLYRWDVTKAATQELAGDHILSLVLKDRASAGRTIEFDAHETVFSPVLEVLTDVSSGVAGEEGLRPSVYRLEQNYPNPFNPTTLIRYEVATAGQVRLAVYDMLGREVARLVDARQGAGRYQVSFNAEGLSSGVYFYRLAAGQFIQTHTMMVLK